MSGARVTTVFSRGEGASKSLEAKRVELMVYCYGGIALRIDILVCDFF